MKRIYLYLAFLALLSSCVTQRRCYTKFPPIVTRDSIYVEKITNVPVYFPGDTVTINVPVNCPDQEIAFIENSKLTQEIRILKGKLISTIHIKPDTIIVKVPEIHTVIKEVKISDPVKYVPKFYKYSLIIALIFIAYIAYRLVRK